uniref:Uncharacterized protein n=1 Tax=viral metagenome TaxID=1070528 RepID=A0A6C0BDS2_9ZZZZ
MSLVNKPLKKNNVIKTLIETLVIKPAVKPVVKPAEYKKGIK